MDLILILILYTLQQRVLICNLFIIFNTHILVCVSVCYNDSQSLLRHQNIN